MIDAANFYQTETLKTGIVVKIRAIRPDDKDKLSEAFRNLEPESIYSRFFHHKKELNENDLKTFTEIDSENVVALVVTVGDGMNEIIIGAGRYVVLDSTETARSAEVAFTVEEDYHGQGIASLLLKHLAYIARYKGVTQFEAEVLSENRAMQTVFSRSGLPMKKKSEAGTMHVILSLKEEDA